MQERPPIDPVPQRLPFVSVVVPTRNRAGLLVECIEGLTRQEYPRELYEVIVVDDGSSDDTPSRIAPSSSSGLLPKVLYVRQECRGLNVARNTGIRTARGDPICLVDDDTYAPSGWLLHLVSGSQRYPEAGCLGGPIRLRVEGKLPRHCGREKLGETEFDLGTADALTRCVFGANMAIRRASIEIAGEFNEALSGPGDDEEWQLRVWKRQSFVVYVHEAWLWHRRTQPNLDFLCLAKKRFSWGAKEVLFEKLIRRRGSPLRDVYGAAVGIFHAVRRRCAFGILKTLWHLGRLWGVCDSEVSSRMASRRAATCAHKDSRPIVFRRRGASR